MRTGRRMVFTEPGRPLVCETGAVASPGAGEVLLRTVIAGVCGTDAHRLGGDLPAPSQPVTFGHEGIGEIVALGAGVSTDAVGTPVRDGDLVYFSPSSLAKPGEPSGPGWPAPAHIPNPAAYQDHPTLPVGNAFYRIPEGVDPKAVIAFGCAMPTALGGMARLGGIAPRETVVVQGSGPVGLSATVLAGLSTAAQIIVIGDPAARLAAATRLGATSTIPLAGTTAEERRAEVLERTGGRGADVVFECAGRMEAFAEGMSLLAPGGRYVVMGIYSGHGGVALDVVRLNNLSQRIIGTMGPTSPHDYLTTIHLAARHGARLGFADLITHRFGLEELEHAIGVAGRGESIKTIVVPAKDAR